jgi:DNA-binding CsgD family transcriptional regulator
MRGCCVSGDVHAAVVDALHDHDVVMVIAPAGAIERCVERIGAVVADVLVVRAGRLDAGRPGALATRLADRARVLGRRPAAVLIAELERADAASIDALAEYAAAIADGESQAAPADRIVVVSRAGCERAEVAALELVARRAGAVVTVRSEDVESLVAIGIEPDRAVELVRATGGAMDLIELLTDGGSLVDDVAARLSVVSPAARSCAELLAFGADPSAAETLALLLGGADIVDTACGALAAEGLLVDGSMPPAVADAVRQTGTAARRARVVEQLCEHGPAGIGIDLAVVLDSLGDRSAIAAELYVEQARSLASTEPSTAAHFVGVARECAVEPSSLAVVAALVEIARGDPVGALRALHDAAGEEAELCRAVAWVALGDLAAASGPLSRSSTPALAVWASIGSGIRPTAAPAPVGAGAAEPAAVLARAVSVWASSEGSLDPAVHDDLRRSVVGFRADPAAALWPVSPDEVCALIVSRFGDVDLAERVITRAVAERPGGFRQHARHRLIAAWLEARRGLLDAAAAQLDELAHVALGPSERFLLSSARCAVAVRDAESTDVDEVAAAAASAMASIGTSVYDTDLVAEISAAIHRSRRSADLDPLAAQHALAERLDDDRLRADVAWARLRSVMAGNDVVEVRRAASRLATMPQAWPPARDTADLFGADAPVDVHRVSEVASRLAASGLPHEAARLCGLLATTTSDEHAARSLLRESRVWRAARAKVKRSAGVDHTVVRLSEQEERVARMVLDGHTHKQIGAVLFVSPKTVEHHVAHIRTKLGCTNRAEMMAALRDYLATV